MKLAALESDIASYNTTIQDLNQQLSSATKRVVSTDIPRRRLPAFIDLAARAKEAEVTSVQFTPPLIKFTLGWLNKSGSNE